MPISGMKPGDRVITPSGRTAVVIAVKGYTNVTIRYTDSAGGTRRTRQSTLRLLPRDAK